MIRLLHHWCRPQLLLQWLLLLVAPGLVSYPTAYAATTAYAAAVKGCCS
jgi:hypothetical protein